MAAEAEATRIHRFERAGLGIAPFRCIGMVEKVYQACHGAPIQPGGACDYCGNGIRYCFIIRDARGETFMVGSECVNKTHDKALVNRVAAEVRTAKREKSHAKDDARIAAAIETLESEDVARALRNRPHPTVFMANSGHTLLDFVLYVLAHGGRSGKVRAAQAIERAAADVESSENLLTGRT